MTGKPRNIKEAIEELEDGAGRAGPTSAEGSNGTGAADMRARLEQELHRIEDLLKNFKPQIEDLSHKVTDEAKKAKERVENEVSKNPWAALGVVGLIFFVLGFLFGFSGSRRRD